MLAGATTSYLSTGLSRDSAEHQAGHDLPETLAQGCSRQMQSKTIVKDYIAIDTFRHIGQQKGNIYQKPFGPFGWKDSSDN